MSNNTISRDAIFSAIAGLDKEQKEKMEAMLRGMGIEPPKRKKLGGYTVHKVKIPDEYFLCWQITCQLCSSEEHKFFYMKQNKELGCLCSTPVDNPDEYQFVSWQVEKKKRTTCPACLQWLEAQPHTQVCAMLIEARKLSVSIPVY